MEIQLWRELLDPYSQAVSEVELKLNNVIREFHRKNRYCPIVQVSGRVKSVSSILEKMQRKNISFDSLAEEMEDIAGIRVVCHFVEDIDTAIILIQNRSDMVIRQYKDYMTEHKKSGYRSYHLVVDYTVQTLDGPRTLPVEIQIRTIAMDFWATSEHFLQYKYKGQLPKHVAGQLQRIAEATEVLDNEMMKVRNDVMDAEIDSQLRSSLVSDILNTLENLFRKKNQREVIKIQEEFYRIYCMNDLEELQHFHDQLDLLSEDNRTQSVQSKDGEEI